MTVTAEMIQLSYACRHQQVRPPTKGVMPRVYVLPAADMKKSMANTMLLWVQSNALMIKTVDGIMEKQKKRLLLRTLK